MTTAASRRRLVACLRLAASRSGRRREGREAFFTSIRTNSMPRKLPLLDSSSSGRMPGSGRQKKSGRARDLEPQVRSRRGLPASLCRVRSCAPHAGANVPLTPTHAVQQAASAPRRNAALGRGPETARGAAWARVVRAVRARTNGHDRGSRAACGANAPDGRGLERAPRPWRARRACAIQGGRLPGLPGTYRYLGTWYPGTRRH